MGKMLGVVLAALLMCTFASALNDTQIDYTPYREVIPGEAGAVYEIRITNTGNRSRTYEIVPDDSIRNIGTYRIDPWHTFTLKGQEQAISYLYISFNPGSFTRKEIPVTVSSGNSSAQIIMVARPIGPFEQQADSRTARNLLAALLIVIMILAIIFLFTRRKKKDDMETYY